jgi:hypothetical protein
LIVGDFVLVLVLFYDLEAPTTWHKTEPLLRRFGQSGDNADPLRHTWPFAQQMATFIRHITDDPTGRVAVSV